MKRATYLHFHLLWWSFKMKTSTSIMNLMKSNSCLRRNHLLKRTKRIKNFRLNCRLSSKNSIWLMMMFKTSKFNLLLTFFWVGRGSFPHKILQIKLMKAVANIKICFLIAMELGTKKMTSFFLRVTMMILTSFRSKRIK